MTCKNTNMMTTWTVLLPCVCLLATVLADVPASCAKPYDAQTIEDLLKVSKEWSGLRSDELRVKYIQWFSDHGDNAYGV